MKTSSTAALILLCALVFGSVTQGATERCTLYSNVCLNAYWLQQQRITPFCRLPVNNYPGRCVRFGDYCRCQSLSGPLGSQRVPDNERPSRARTGNRNPAGP